MLQMKKSHIDLKEYCGEYNRKNDSTVVQNRNYL